MKKLLLFVMSIGACTTILAQEGYKPLPKVKEELKNLHVTRPASILNGSHAQSNNQAYKKNTAVLPATGGGTTAPPSTTETTIGETLYDLQTNASVCRRLVNHGNGTVSAAWTYSNSSAFTTRGTGYNFFDGSAWGPAPTSEVETVRTGWSTIGVNGSGQEMILAHNTSNDVIAQTTRNTVGSGTWTETAVNNSDVEVWSRTAIGGSNGNTIHMIGLTLPTNITTGNPGTVYANGFDGALLYNRSLNGGSTWDVVNFYLPNLDTTNFDSTGVNADSYSIDAEGNTVVILHASLGSGVQMWKSNDNGTTWAYSTILVPEFPKFNEAVTLIPADPALAMYTSDGHCSVILDDNGDAHAFFGRMFITNDVINDGLIGFFPFQNGIEYWNESFGNAPPVTVAGSIDTDGDGVAGSGIGAAANLPSYGFNGLAGQMSTGKDANGTLYLAYAAVREDLSNTVQNYRHIYAVKSEDNGCSWTFPVDLTGAAANNFSECVYPSLARLVDSKLHVVFQRDVEPGIHVSGDEDPQDDNDIVYLTTDVTDLGPTLGACVTYVIGDTNLCNGFSTTLTAAGCATAYSWSNGGTTQSITVNTIGTYTVSMTTPCGVIEESLNVVNPFGGPVVTLTPSQFQMCPGDVTTITANSNTVGSNYIWSTLGSTQSITVNSPGTYTVTVTTCGGNNVQSITIVQPNSPPSALINGSPTICPGATDTLEASAVTGGSYIWSTGSSSQTAPITAAGTYTLTVTNCGGTSTSTYIVTPEPAPVAAVNALAGITEVCIGDAVTLFASGGFSYVWSNGETTPSITLDEVAESGAYSVTVSNKCGDTDVANISVTINDLPAAPTITFSNGEYSTTATGNLQWFINGVEQAGQTGQTFTNNVPSGATLSVIVTDPNTGCSSQGTLTGINDLVSGNSSIRVYPNPNNGEFGIYFTDAASDKYEISIRNVLGQQIHAETFQVAGNTTKSIDLSEFDKGVYFLTTSNSNGEATERIIIE